MPKGRPHTVGKSAVSTRTLFSRADYEALLKLADEERTDVSTLIRRAVARYFFVPDNGNNNNMNK